MMSSKQVLCFVTLCLGLTFSLYSQKENYFNQLAIYENQLSKSDFLDSLSAIPYATMVDELLLSEQWLKKGITQSRLITNEEKEATFSGKLATVFYLQGKYDSSTYYNLEAIRIYEGLKMDIKKGEVLCDQGYQTKRRDLEQAFSYFRKGIYLLEKNNADESAKSHAYDNYGVLFEMRNDLDSAAYFYNESLKRKEFAKDSVGIPYSLNKIAQLNLIHKKFDVAKEYFDKAYEIRARLNDEFGLAENETFYGDLYSASGNWNLAIDWYKKSIISAEKLKYPMLLQYNYEQLVLCYEKSGRYQEALQAARKSAEIKDELLNEKNSHTILELEERYQSAEKDRNISRLETETTRKKFTIYAVIALAVTL